MIEENDWRLWREQEDYLKDEILVFKKKYKKHSIRWDHEHCEFCTRTISEYEGDLHEAYCTEDETFWICCECC